MYGQSAGTKKSGCCKDVAVSEGSSVLQTHLRMGSLIRMGGVFNLAKIMVSVLHKEL